MVDLAVAVGKRIRAYRNLQGLTQEDLAERAGLHDTYIGQVERGEKNLTIKSLGKIASALGVAASDLLAHTDESRVDSIPQKIYSLVISRPLQEQEMIEGILYQLISFKDRS